MPGRLGAAGTRSRELLNTHPRNQAADNREPSQRDSDQRKPDNQCTCEAGGGHHCEHGSDPMREDLAASGGTLSLLHA